MSKWDGLETVYRKEIEAVEAALDELHMAMWALVQGCNKRTARIYAERAVKKTQRAVVVLTQRRKQHE